ncbi:probable beta-D-xylosidase 2 [Mercurialis annua]|uniref:probable beta-D-xylosidase 2 n=1 Tax=Mercurialis annua TaxID=3986 RepID=UPI00215E75C9|nr:probable beta-D-xylosidase 2 [Mercurialis annua]
MDYKILFIILVTIVSIQMRFSTAREPFACDPKAAMTKNLTFCKTTLPIQARVKDILSRLTLQEKITSLINTAAPIPRLGIEKYEWWSEALHGVSNVGPGTKFGGAFPGATSFPQVITTASSFNATLWEKIGQVVSDEARAMYNGGMGGLTYWSPNVNIFRDPRWGRGQETPGEDPLVTGVYAVSYVRGLQGYDRNKLKVAACCKHFTAYDLDNWNGVDRFHFNASVSKQELEDTYNVPFKMCVEQGKVASVMCSYNQVNGVPTCADRNLWTETVRNKWNLYGYVVSDCDSVGVLFDQQHYTKTPEEAAAISIKAGLNLDCGPFLALHTENAIKQNLVKVEDVDSALGYLLTTQIRLGMFDGEPSVQKYGQLGSKDVCTQAHQDLALEAARQGIVLLKNLNATLPLSSRTHRTVAVIGPNSNVTVTMIGNYAGIACGYTTPLQGISTYAETIYQTGCNGTACGSDAQFGGAVDAARQAEATVLVMGLDQSFEQEMRDRVDVLLPGHQQDLISRVANASKGPVILVLMSGGPIDVSFAENDPRISAILWAGYPGQAGGAAIADVLFGTTNPGGKLSVTWYPQDYLAKVPMTNMAMRQSTNYPGRTYRFYNGPVVYPFGHGLTYTKFLHKPAKIPSEIKVSINGHHRNRNLSSMTRKSVLLKNAKCKNLLLNIDVDVKNVGSVYGTETLLVFSTPPSSIVGAPLKQLVAFEKVGVAAMSERRVRIKINVCDRMSIVDKSGNARLALGQYLISIGDIKHSVSIVPY